MIGICAFAPWAGQRTIVLFVKKRPFKGEGHNMMTDYKLLEWKKQGTYQMLTSIDAAASMQRRKYIASELEGI